MSKREVETKAREHETTDITPEVMAEAAQAAGDVAVGVYQKIEDGVVTGYKKMESGIVDGFGKVVDKCVEVLFARKGESVEDAKRRLNGEDRK